MKTKNLLTAKKLGQAAFHAGNSNVPAQNKEIMDFIYSDLEVSGSAAVELMKSFADGWTGCHLSSVGLA